MPAPSTEIIKGNIRLALLARGYYYKKNEDNNLVEDKTRLPDDMEELVIAIAEGINVTWIAWMSTQSITVPDIMPGSSTTIGTFV